jgi:YD repeat-containing protein
LGYGCSGSPYMGTARPPAPTREPKTAAGWQRRGGSAASGGTQRRKESAARRAFKSLAVVRHVVHSDGTATERRVLWYDAARWPIAKLTLDGVDATRPASCHRSASTGRGETRSFDPVVNGSRQDLARVGVRAAANRAYDAADQITTETSGTAVTTYTFGQAGNEQVVQTPAGHTTKPGIPRIG